MPEAFHFIAPLWLLALLPLPLLLWLLISPGGGDNPWTRVVDAQLLPMLLTGRFQSAGSAPLWLLTAGWVIAVLALANPTWERQSQPVYQTTAARVIVLDLSQSMNAPDLEPSRLARARYKVEDILRHGGEGQTGLLVFAGDAFTVSPLTRDVNTIRALLKAVDTKIMPAQGSRVDLGLQKAGELLRQAGLGSGDVLLISDGVDEGRPESAERAAAQLRQSGFRVSVLGVGTAAGAPVPGPDGGLLRDASGKLVSAGLESENLQAVARAGGGTYRQISAGDDDIDALLAARGALHADSTVQSDLKTDKWKETGPLVALLLLPLAALAFRRGWLLGVLLSAGVLAPPQPAHASAWDELWLRPEQQAARALSAGDYARAAQLATDPARRGSAEYKRGNYQPAADGFAQAGGADADYNRGNALAKLGRYQDALAAYDEALKARPDMDDARANKAAVEALLKKSPPPTPQQNSQQNPQQEPAPSQSDKQNGKGEQQAGAQRKEQSSGGGENAKKDASSGADSKPQNKAGNQFARANQALERKGAEPPGKDGSAATASGAPQGEDKKPVTPQDEGKQAAAPQDGKPRNNARVSGEAENLDSEERLAADQWLRRIPDDPGGLLRRKFQYQYRQREQRANSGSNQSW